jgi:hypothetical protein
MKLHQSRNDLKKIFVSIRYIRLPAIPGPYAGDPRMSTLNRALQESLRQRTGTIWRISFLNASRVHRCNESLPPGDPVAASGFFLRLKLEDDDIILTFLWIFRDTILSHELSLYWPVYVMETHFFPGQDPDGLLVGKVGGHPAAYCIRPAAHGISQAGTPERPGRGTGLVARVDRGDGR